MLNSYFGDMPEAIYNTEVYFKNTYQDAWICDVAMCLSDEELQNMSWSTFVLGCSQYPELVQYLKERRLYVNEPVQADQEV